MENINFPPIQKWNNETLLIKDKKRSEEKGPMKNWYISQTGSCMRGLYYNRLGYKPDNQIDARTLSIFDLGNKIEDQVVDLLKQGGEFGVYNKDELKIETQVPVRIPDLDLSGRMDLLVTYKGEQFPYEIKSKHSRSFWHMDKAGKGPQREHEYQLWLYLYAYKLPKGIIYYVSKDDQSILQYVVYLEDKQLEKEVLDYWNTMNDCWKRKILPPKAKEETWQAKYCNFHKHCLRAEYEMLTNKKVA